MSIDESGYSSKRAKKTAINKENERLFIFPCNGGRHLSLEIKNELENIATQLTQEGKGITACDESAGTIGARFEAVGIENSYTNRQLYREMLLQDDKLNVYVSGAILDPETLTQKVNENSPILFPEALQAQNIVCGVKPHLKVYILPGSGGDTTMQGLDSLDVRLREYYRQGARFTKWRSPFEIDVSCGRPTRVAIEAQMNDLARVALISQAIGMVPIVEPDVVLKGNHDLPTAIAINTTIHSTLYKAMLEHNVFLEGCVLKTNMVTPGLACSLNYTVEEIAKATCAVLGRTMPSCIRGVNFLSGGQCLNDACARLSAINQAKGKLPWNLSFSWSSALQMPLLQLCKGRTLQESLKDMKGLYFKELGLAQEAAQGKFMWTDGQGSH